MGWSLCKALGFNSPARKVSDVDELAPGIPRPSSVLAGMVATRLIQYPENFSVSRYESTYETTEWTDSKMSVEYKEVRGGGLCFLYVHFKKRKYHDFRESDLLKIKEAFKKGLTLRKEKDEILRKEKAEQEACDIIQELFGEPVVEEQQAA